MYPNSCDEPPVNAGQELSGIALTVARRNARHMTRRGYEWEVCSRDYPRKGESMVEAGTVYPPKGEGYTVWLPGMLAFYGEGRCTCPYFLQNAICKHIFFAVEENDKAIDAYVADWEPAY